MLKLLTLSAMNAEHARSVKLEPTSVCLSVCLSVSLSLCLSVSLSVRPFHHPAATRRCGGFAAVGPAARRYRSTAALPALSSKCGQCHVVSWRSELNTDLLYRMGQKTGPLTHDHNSLNSGHESVAPFFGTPCIYTALFHHLMLVAQNEWINMQQTENKQTR